MIKEWQGQTKEEWLREYHRNKNLTPEEREKELDGFLSELKKRDDAVNKEQKLQKQENLKNRFANYDHPNSLENNEATMLWVIVMIIGTIFKGNWIIWIIATIIWRKYVTRHKIKN